MVGYTACNNVSKLSYLIWRHDILNYTMRDIYIYSWDLVVIENVNKLKYVCRRMYPLKLWFLQNIYRFTYLILIIFDYKTYSTLPIIPEYAVRLSPTWPIFSSAACYSNAWIRRWIPCYKLAFIIKLHVIIPYLIRPQYQYKVNLVSVRGCGILTAFIN